MKNLYFIAILIYNTPKYKLKRTGVICIFIVTKEYYI